jgi:hypothetical protein
VASKTNTHEEVHQSQEYFLRFGAIVVVDRGLVRDCIDTRKIERRFGYDVFKTSWDEASSKWKDKHKAELEKISHSE